MKVVVLGAGPAGLGAALGLAERGIDVEVVERRDTVGGNAGSFELAGVHVDYGSHRLHPAADPSVLERLRGLLGPDLLTRPRHGRIRLLGHWIHFPLRPADLALRLPPRFALGATLDMVRGMFPARPPEQETFATILERGLGRTICRDFYFPYARKMWGLSPEEISPTQAEKRVSARSIVKLLRRLLPGAGPGAASTKGIFYYPRRGFGQISERLAQAATEEGARLALGTTVTRVRRRDEGGFEVEVETGGQARTLPADHVWSTIPSPVLARLIDPLVPEDVLRAAGRLELRAMLLVYLVLDQDRFTEYDAHYFPEAGVAVTRLSEPKNYAATPEPHGRTVLCAEIPCSRSDDVWSMDDEGLKTLVQDALARLGLPIKSHVLKVAVRRLPQAYPIYRRGYEGHFELLDSCLSGIDDLASFGRQGLFAHDNTHHALFTAQAAVDCLDDDGRFDREKWAHYREVFATHVVED